MWAWPGNKTSLFMFRSSTWPVQLCVFQLVLQNGAFRLTDCWTNIDLLVRYAVHPLKLRFAVWNGRAASVTDIFRVSRQRRYPCYIGSIESQVWQYFEFDADEKKSSCTVKTGNQQVCGKQFPGKYPTNWKNHLRIAHPEVLYTALLEKEETERKSKAERSSRERRHLWRLAIS